MILHRETTLKQHMFTAQSAIVQRTSLSMCCTCEASSSPRYLCDATLAASAAHDINECVFATNFNGKWRCGPTSCTLGTPTPCCKSCSSPQYKDRSDGFTVDLPSNSNFASNHPHGLHAKLSPPLIPNAPTWIANCEPPPPRRCLEAGRQDATTEEAPDPRKRQDMSS